MSKELRPLLEMNITRLSKHVKQLKALIEPFRRRARSGEDLRGTLMLSVTLNIALDAYYEAAKELGENHTDAMKRGPYELLRSGLAKIELDYKLKQAEQMAASHVAQ